MDKLIDEYYKGCETCIKNKTRSSRPIGRLSWLGPAESPFAITSLDTVGGFVGNGSKKKYMHLLVDHYTRKAFISTSANQTSKEIFKLIDRVTQNANIGTLMIDQYSALSSKELKTYIKWKGIQLIYTAVDNASSNGLSERLNQTLDNRIRCKMNGGDRRAWTVIAQECVEEYNNTPHTVTKFPPNYLMSGQMRKLLPPELEPNKKS